ncbi:hypothetical protein CKAN_02288900 [Cinnamomum micranthum f. kanehirae]|uniref:Uncharacterized protein n=1 Tax=Cinnamomum micranthum f. kanehirae TaxID=337451 RepID=A0A3S3NST0_9MAGN|nr:hypothetical protein CKAN_02288900 [Cinnamomum micranthum f. kanehirae]
MPSASFDDVANSQKRLSSSPARRLALHRSYLWPQNLPVFTQSVFLSPTNALNKQTRRTKTRIFSASASSSSSLSISLCLRLSDKNGSFILKDGIL